MSGGNFFFDGDVEASGEEAYGAGEVNVFIEHDKFEDVAAMAAAKAFKEAFRGIDVEGWCFFFVEWAEGAVLFSGAF